MLVTTKGNVLMVSDEKLVTKIVDFCAANLRDTYGLSDACSFPVVSHKQVAGSHGILVLMGSTCKRQLPDRGSLKGSGQDLWKRPMWCALLLQT